MSFRLFDFILVVLLIVLCAALFVRPWLRSVLAVSVRSASSPWVSPTASSLVLDTASEDYYQVII